MNTSVNENFKTILLKHNEKDFKYLLAISGGIDSMVLLDLFRQTSTLFQVAHCNFQLRDEDSMLDEKLVRDYCGKHNIPFHSIHFDVEGFKATGNYSTEMACRILRYDWFAKIIEQNHLDYLVTAHHLNDNIETFFINLSRGTGLKGLTGIKIDSNKIFRPLLNCTKAEILEYAKDNYIEWREDYTNQSDDFIRNKIRHHITPILKNIHPNFETNFNKTLNYLNDANDFISNQIENIRSKVIPNEQYAEIKIKDLETFKNKNFILFHLFEKYGFKDVSLINKLIYSKNSSEIQSKNYRLIKNRDFLTLKNIDDEPFEEIIINQAEIKINSLTLKLVKSNQRLNEAKEIIDSKNIKFPLKFRKPKTGDYFYPLGMNGQKKLVSKFFKDLKLSKIEKENTWLLVDSNDEIIWIVDYRLDERFKIKNNSKEFLNIIVC